MKYVPIYRIGRYKRLHPEIPEFNDRRAFVYFLMHGKRIMYIGKTEHLRSRLNYHNCYLKFNNVRFIQCSPETLSYYERRWIEKFQPIYNTMHTKKADLPVLERYEKVRKYTEKLKALDKLPHGGRKKTA